MYIKGKIRYKEEKNLIKYNKIPAIININKTGILIKLDNNKYYYDILKIEIFYFIKILNKLYKVKCEFITYHPYFKLILNIIFKKENDNK